MTVLFKSESLKGSGKASDSNALLILILKMACQLGWGEGQTSSRSNYKDSSSPQAGGLFRAWFPESEQLLANSISKRRPRGRHRGRETGRGETKEGVEEEKEEEEKKKEENKKTKEKEKRKESSFLMLCIFLCLLTGSLLKKYFIVTQHRVIKDTLEIWTLLPESGLK